MTLGDGAQLPEEWDFLIGAPGSYCESTACCQGSTHLARRRGLVGKELQPWWADDNVELFAVTQGQRVGVAFPPVDARGHGARDSEHVRADIDPNNVTSIAEPLACHTSDYSCPAGNVENPISGRQGQLIESHFGPRLE